MKYRLYTTSQKAWDGMLSSIEEAKSSIYIEMFIFLGDTKNTHDFLGLLKRKAKADLEVIIIADSYGSSALKGSTIKELREAGIEFHYFRGWIKRTHRKILVIDYKVAFLGGVNIKDEIRHWHDLQIKLEGRIVRPILKSFAKSYRRCNGKKKHILDLVAQPLSQKIKAWITDNWSSTKKIYYLNHYYKTKIAEARQSIQIVTPYILPPRWLIVYLKKACRRGVKIEIVFPADTDVKPLNKVNYLNACRLSALGIKLFLTPTMNHAKLMLIDNKEGVIGSQNMDIFSFGMNAEAGVFFSQKDLVADLKKIFETWRSESTPLKVKYKKIRWYDKILIHVFKVFYPIF